MKRGYSVKVAFTLISLASLFGCATSKTISDHDDVTSTRGLASGETAQAGALIEVNAKTVTGYDYVSKTQAQDCLFIVSTDSNAEFLAVGLNSNSAQYGNVLVRIPRSSLPLRDGQSFTDLRGYHVSYTHGTLVATRAKDDQPGGYTETDNLQIVVSPDLKRVTAGQVQKSERKLLSSSPLAQMSCVF